MQQEETAYLFIAYKNDAIFLTFQVGWLEGFADFDFNRDHTPKAWRPHGTYDDM